MYDDAANARHAAAERARRAIFVDYPKQNAIRQRIETLRLITTGVRGRPLPGLRLSQVSHAGKSKTLERYIAELATRRAEEDLPPNERQVIYIGLKRRVTVKMLYQRILAKLGDPHPEVGNVEVLIQRAEELMARFAVELLFVDEVQHLAGSRSDSREVTDELKSFLDAGLVSVIFAGNEESKAFFEENQQLAARLGVPLELSPTDVKSTSELSDFMTFVERLDGELDRSGAVRKPSGFTRTDTMQALLVASGGHVGRVCRIVEAALEHATRRDADFVERYDLSYAVRHLAIPSNWVKDNPFPEPEGAAP